MKVHSQIDTKRDGFGNIHITSCPNQLRTCCERIMEMVTSLGYRPPSYHSITELDKKIVLQYWRRFDGLIDTNMADYDFSDWWLKKATNPDIISRSLRWLASSNYIFLDKDVAHRAQEASRNYRQAMSEGR